MFVMPVAGIIVGNYYWPTAMKGLIKNHTLVAPPDELNARNLSAGIIIFNYFWPPAMTPYANPSIS